MQELRHPKAPDAVKAWLVQVPTWIEVTTVKVPPDGTMSFLDPGEREAIQLAQEDLLLIDERRGRTEAMRRGLATTGTLGVLITAGERGLFNPKAAYQHLITETKFRMTHIHPDYVSTLGSLAIHGGRDRGCRQGTVHQGQGYQPCYTGIVVMAAIFACGFITTALYLPLKKPSANHEMKCVLAIGQISLHH